MPTGADPLAHIAVLTPVLREIRRKPLLMALVIRPRLGRMLGGMALTPPPHYRASFLGVALNPGTSVLASTLRVLVWHVADLAARPSRGNRTGAKKTRPSWPRHCCGGTIRTSGLRVMSPTSYRCSTPRPNSTLNESQRRTLTTARSATEPHSRCDPMPRSPARRAAP